MGKKAQGALEFLMTYGWAFLVILIMIGALAYFGVLNPDRFLPERCSVSPQVGCDAFVLHNTVNSTIVLELTNNFQSNVYVCGFSMSSSDNPAFATGVNAQVTSDPNDAHTQGVDPGAAAGSYAAGWDSNGDGLLGIAEYGHLFVDDCANAANVNVSHQWNQGESKVMLVNVDGADTALTEGQKAKVEMTFKWYAVGGSIATAKDMTLDLLATVN